MSPQLRDRIDACPDLPSLPAIAVQVLELAQADEADLTRIASVISQDPALTGKILKTVNSSFYGRARAVGTISQAMVVLGLQSVKTLVLGFSLVGGMNTKKKDGAFDHKRYWKHSLFTAAAARQIAQRVNLLQVEEVFLAGLLADIGMLVLDRVIGEAYGKVANAPSHQSLAAAEIAAFQTTHGEVSGYLVGQWKLPPLLATPIEFHHDSINVTDPALKKLADVVGMASQCADVFNDADPSAALAALRGKWFPSFGIDQASGDAMMAEIHSKAKEIASLFDINIGESEPYERVLQRANEALIKLMLQTQQQNQQLRVAATTDHLTGLNNRQEFESRAGAMFAETLKTENGAMSVILLDLDRFKSINDTHGHPAGDAVLKAVGKLVMNNARGCDVAARYGGEEMIIALPDTPQNLASAVAESMRSVLRSKPIQVDGVDIAVTASFGVATYEIGSPLKSLAHLVKAADLALYQAKHTGRDRVKVFTTTAAQAA
ncbi:MAG: GGDEF domain-containing protein [Tepidisphaeraceae bacterium]